MHRRWKTLLLTFAGISAIAAYTTPLWLKPLRIRYHLDRLERAKNGALPNAPWIAKLPVIGSFFRNAPPYVNRGTWESDQIDLELQNLVDLDAIDFEHIELKHLKNATREGRHFLRFLLKTTG